MWLHRKDINKISDILEKFPDVSAFKLEQQGETGIGNYTIMTFEQEINGYRGSFTIEISGVEDW